MQEYLIIILSTKNALVLICHNMSIRVIIHIFVMFIILSIVTENIHTESHTTTFNVCLIVYKSIYMSLNELKT